LVPCTGGAIDSSDRGEIETSGGGIGLEGGDSGIIGCWSKESREIGTSGGGGGGEGGDSR
jgi:hypothetical protein